MDFYPSDAIIHAPWSHKTRGLVAVPDNYLDHTIEDPPYSEYVHAKKWSGGNKKSGPKSKKVSFEHITEKQIKEHAKHVVRTTRGWALIFCADDDIHIWRNALSAAGALRWPLCIWTKPNGTPQFRGEGPAQPCEFIVTAWCGLGRPQWNGGGKLGRYDVPVETTKNRVVDTQKPIRLMKNIVLDFTRPNDLIGDCFGGGGTLAVAARETGRRFVLWEMQKDRVELATTRVEAAREQLHMESLLHAARPEAYGRVREKRAKKEQSGLFDEG